MDVTAMCDKLTKLHLAGKSSLCLEKPNTEYVIHLDSQSCSKSNTSALLAASSSNLNVRLYSRNSLVYSRTLSGHTKTITGLRFSRGDSNLLYTSSIDGKIRCWDLRTESLEAAICFEGYTEINNRLSSLDVSCDGNFICAGTDVLKEDAYLIFWDVRTAQKLGAYSDSHQNDVTQVSFHPSIVHKMVSSSMDGLICLFDISQSCEDDALQSTLNCESAVTQIGWVGPDSNRIYGITSINGFYIWDTETLDTVLSKTDIKSGQGGVGVDYLVDCFQTSADDLYLLTGSFRGDMSVFSVTDDAVQPCFSLPKAHSGVIRCINWDEMTQSLVTGGEDSMLCLWKRELKHKNKRKAETTTPPPLKNKTRKSSSLDGLPR